MKTIGQNHWTKHYQLVMKTITSLSAVINSLWFYLEIKLVLIAQVSCFQDKPFNITVIQAYAPTSNAEEAEVEWFCEDL